MSNIERDDRITPYSLLLHRGDYAAFRAWATESGYGDSAVAFRGLWRAFTQQRGAVEDADRLREVLRAVLMEPDPIKRNQLAAPVLTNPGGQ